jgi:acyl-CoA synthetase (AMP-forming)/AMP-acid ligase II
MDLTLVLEMAVNDDPDRMAVTGVHGTGLSRAQLRQAARRTAARLRTLGATHAGYLGTNGAGLPVALFGAALAGIPFVPLNYRLSGSQLNGLLGREPGMVLVAGEGCLDAARGAPVRAVVEVAELLPAPGEPPPADATEPPPLPVDPDAIALLLYTSGTTAAPKAAVLRHRHLMAYILGTVEFGSAGPDDAVLVSVPPYHIAGVSSVLSNLYCGRRIVYLDPFEPGRWLELVRREAVTHAMVVPTMLARIVDHLDAERGGASAEVPSLRSLAYGGSRMPAPVIARALELCPDVEFTNAYGLTETSSTITILGPEDHRRAAASRDPAVRARLGSAGRAVPGVELRVAGPSGDPCPAGEVGDVLVRGEQVSGEYLGSSAVDRDGWFATRDRGHLDADGYLFIDGRADDTIIRGGENVAPAEIEDVLLRHPAVRECAVVGLPDSEWGERIAAAVVLVPGQGATPQELQGWSRQHLRGAKTPDVVEIRPQLPYTDTGKLLRRQVRDSFT